MKKLCCCGHNYEVHIGGEEFSQWYIENSPPDGGMCRKNVGGKRCGCFNFCDCYIVAEEITK